MLQPVLDFARRRGLRRERSITRGASATNASFRARKIGNRESSRGADGAQGFAEATLGGTSPCMLTRMRVLVLGGSGLVGSRACQLWGGDAEVVAPSHGELDVLDTPALSAFVECCQPDAIVNLAAWADVDAAEPQRDDKQGTVFALNVRFPGELARLCVRSRRYLVHVSTDYVFDGTRLDRPYSEADTPNPLCWYAQTKYWGEQRVLEAHPDACIARIEMPFTATEHRKSDFPRLVVRRLTHGQSVAGVLDQRITPVLLDDAVFALRALVDRHVGGIVHVASTSWTTPYELARAIASRMALDSTRIEATKFDEFATTRPARRPQHSWLDVSFFEQACASRILRTVDAQLDAWVAQASGTQSANISEDRWSYTSSR